MKRLVLFIFIIQSSLLYSQDEIKSIYSGGMLVFQPGVTITSNEYQDIKQFSNSVGGLLRIYFAKYLTAGLYGGNQKTPYPTQGSKNSYLNLGYGGAFFGYSQKFSKLRVTASFYVGGGRFKNLHINKQNNNDLLEAKLFKNSTFLYSPIISIDYAIINRIYFTVQSVCLIGKYNNRQFYNPTLQVGLLFSR